jgi:hypothetical protein
MATLPELTPTAMDFTAPEFPVKSNTSLSGVVSRRIFGSRGSRSTLQLSFDNITDASAVQFLNAWNASRGQTDAVTVPSQVFDGADATLTAYVSDGGDDLIWHFAAPPQVQRVKPGISSVRISLEATRDF